MNIFNPAVSADVCLLIDRHVENDAYLKPETMIGL